MTPWTVTRQASLSMGFPRQEYWSGLLFPFPGDHLDPVIEPMSPALAGRFFTTEPLGKPQEGNIGIHITLCFETACVMSSAQPCKGKEYSFQG